MATRKEVFAEKVQIAINNIAKNIDVVIDLKDVYTSEAYAAGGADEIVDEDIESLGILAADLHDVVTTVVPALSNLVNSLAVGAGVYAAKMDKVRIL